MTTSPAASSAAASTPALPVPPLPQGYSLGGVYCGIKRYADKLDLSLIVSERPAVAAGVYTTNLVFAAPVKWDREHTPGTSLRGIVINSGNANACTGERGDADCRRMAEAAAQTCGATADQMLVLSTGIIGEFMPMQKIEAGVRDVAGKLGTDEAALVAAARGMLTTDTRHKVAGRTIALSSGSVQLTGMAKGAAMIGPKMATMLGIVLTDAALAPKDAQRLLSSTVEDSFNCISVDGHMSTNDTVLLLANGAAGGAPLQGADLAKFEAALGEVCGELARMIPADGEGATHLIQVEIQGGRDRESARLLAKSVSESLLVKTAICGADPNWGRIVSAAGYANVPFDPAKVNLWVNGLHLYENGAPLPFDRVAASHSIRDHRDTHIRLTFGEGTATVNFWTTDLTAEYVRLNADYHT
ncbi:MAG: bifunctional glutamate N-acetyltransferase/amino-acid acetyltransferase ArgJ [Planctomycetia bacterium]|nr:bifunctional glutamate N-acetyltransferase/amino-acid acetyltransferase ArgJ [Planctomycetia bacterium]